MSVLHLVEDASISAPIHKDRLAVPAALGLASTAIVGHAMVTIIADKIIIAIPIIIIMVELKMGLHVRSMSLLCRCQ